MDIDGKKVRSATKPLRIEILPQDIKRAVSKDPAACAAAKAIMRQCDVKACRVHIGRTYLQHKDGTWMRYRTPLALRSEIVALDRGGTFEPGTFVLQSIPPSDHKPRVKSRTNPGTRKKRKHYHTVANIRQHGANR